MSIQKTLVTSKSAAAKTRALTKKEHDDALLQDTLMRSKDIEEGRVVDHAKVVKWLKSWGTDKVLEMPSCGNMDQ